MYEKEDTAELEGLEWNQKGGENKEVACTIKENDKGFKGQQQN